MFEIATGHSLSVLAPVVLDLDGDGVEFTSFATSTILFDMDGDGDLDRTSWVGADDGLLVYDRNGNNIVDNGTEISFQSLVAGAASDLAGLFFFDSNNDFYLDAADAAYGSFRIWKDSNQNGVTDAGELRPLAEAGIVSIALQGDRTGNTPDGRDTVVFATSQYLKSDNSVGAVADSFFVFEPSQTIPPNPSGVDPVPGPPVPAVPAPPTLSFSGHGYERKSKKYVVEARDGSLFVHLKKGGGTVDTRANRVGPAIILNFKNAHVGLLSPIILDLDGDGIDLKSRKKSPASFDMDGDGIRDDTGWVGHGDGLLVIDRNNDGLVTAASELSFLTEKADASSDLDALGALDSNRDGKISASDARFGELKVWVDANDNGVTDTGELKTLTELGITEISLASRANSATVKPGENIIIATSTFKRADGTTGTVSDVALAFDPSSSRPRPLAAAGGSGTTLSEFQLDAIREALSTSTISAQSSTTASALAIDPDATKLALIAQAMASFGVRDGIETSLAQQVQNPTSGIFYAAT